MHHTLRNFIDSQGRQREFYPLWSGNPGDTMTVWVLPNPLANDALDFGVPGIVYPQQGTVYERDIRDGGLKEDMLCSLLGLDPNASPPRNSCGEILCVQVVQRGLWRRFGLRSVTFDWGIITMTGLLHEVRVSRQGREEFFGLMQAPFSDAFGCEVALQAGW